MSTNFKGLVSKRCIQTTLTTITRCLASKVPSEVTVHSGGFKDITTHTGQKFTENDYRLARFVGKEKEVNTRFAIDLVAEAAPIPVKSRNTYCDGGNGPLGHPRVFINLDQPGNHSCGYCGLRFYQDATHH